MPNRSCNAMLVSSALAAEAAELDAWMKTSNTPGQASVFVEDLADWLSFQGLHGPTGGAGSNEEASKSLLRVLAAEAQRPEMLQMMTEVRDVLLAITPVPGPASLDWYKSLTCVKQKCAAA